MRAVRVDHHPSSPGEIAWLGHGSRVLDDPRREIERGRPVYLSLGCPGTSGTCDGHVAVVTIRVSCPGIDYVPDRPGQPVWIWDGSADRPTLNPSIHSAGACNWHGYLTKGEFRDA